MEDEAWMGRASVGSPASCPWSCCRAGGAHRLFRGTSRSSALRDVLSSIARWRECSEPITLPVVRSSAAYRLDVPARLSRASRARACRAASAESGQSGRALGSARGCDGAPKIPSAVHRRLRQRPTFLAIDRVDQCVASRGAVSNVLVITSSICAFGDLARLTRPGLVRQPVQPMLRIAMPRTGRRARAKATAVLS